MEKEQYGSAGMVWSEAEGLLWFCTFKDNSARTPTNCGTDWVKRNVLKT